MNHGRRLWRAVMLAALGVVVALPATTSANEVPDLATYVRALRQELETSRQTIRSLERALTEAETAPALPPPAALGPSLEQQRRLEARITNVEADRDRLTATLAEREEALIAQAAEMDGLREQLASTEASADEIMKLQQQLADLQAAYDTHAAEIDAVTEQLNNHLAQQETLITARDAAKAQTLQAQTERDSLEKNLAAWKASAREEGVVRNGQALREQITRTDDTTLAWSLNDVGLLFARDGRLNEADALYLQAQQILTDQLGPSHAALGTLLQNRAEVRLRKNDLTDAANFYQQAALVFEQALGASHPRLAPLLNDWATVLRNLNQLDQAEILYRRAIELYEQAPGHQPLALATPLHNLAMVLQAGNQHEEAGLMLARAWSVLEPVREQHAGPAIIILRSLRDYYRLLGDTDRAIEYEDRANQLAVTWLAP